VAIDGIGILLRGPSGAGKSDLALRLIDQGAVLVADDQVILTPDNGILRVSPPDTLAGLLEVRGVGIVKLDYQPTAWLGLVVDLVSGEDIERMPEPLSIVLADHPVAGCRLSPWQASSALKVRLAASLARGSIVAMR
jgi:serine kinase of HPr protein (carbohydrate metabolism regulator)